MVELTWKQKDGKRQCIFCCSCIASCPSNALKFLNKNGKELTSSNFIDLRKPIWEDSRLVWDKDKCTKCGSCIKVCPEEVIQFRKK